MKDIVFFIIICIAYIIPNVIQMNTRIKQLETAYLYDTPLKRNELINYEVEEIRIA